MADGKKKYLDKRQFFIALKLVASRQKGKALETYRAECKIGTIIPSPKLTRTEQPLPRFEMEKVKAFVSKLKPAPIDKPCQVQSHILLI